MELYTLVSLIIGIFGAAFGALNSLKTVLEPGLKKAHSSSESRLAAFIRIRGKENGAVGHCRNHSRKIYQWHLVWTWANIIPAIAFFLLISAVTVAVLTQWDDLTVAHKPQDLSVLRDCYPWKISHGLLLWNGLLDLACVVAAVVAWWRCKIADQNLQEHIDSLKTDGTEGPPVTPVA